MPITKEGYAALAKELKHLVSQEKPAIIRAIASARELGDLSENADYHAARERHSFIEGRIAYLEDRLASLEIIDISKLNGDKIVFGATVDLEEAETGELFTFKIVGPDEADIKNKKISCTAPLARALIGREAADNISVKTPKGIKEYNILNVYFK